MQYVIIPLLLQALAFQFGTALKTLDTVLTEPMQIFFFFPHIVVMQ